MFGRDWRLWVLPVVTPDERRRLLSESLDVHLSLPPSEDLEAGRGGGMEEEGSEMEELNGLGVPVYLERSSGA